MSLDPVATNPGHYTVVFENERVRVLEYADSPGDATTSHRHPDSVMITLSGFRRLLVHGDQEREVEMPAGRASWLPGQAHRGVNIGSTETHAIFVELKEAATEEAGTQPARIGPAG
jgi:hypothetical protein